MVSMCVCKHAHKGSRAEEVSRREDRRGERTEKGVEGRGSKYRPWNKCTLRDFGTQMREKRDIQRAFS